jgi:hypothetical protein
VHTPTNCKYLLLPMEPTQSAQAPEHHISPDCRAHREDCRSQGINQERDISICSNIVAGAEVALTRTTGIHKYYTNYHKEGGFANMPHCLWRISGIRLNDRPFEWRLVHEGLPLLPEFQKTASCAGVQRLAKRLLVARVCFPQSFDPSIKGSAAIHRLGSAVFCQRSVIFGKKLHAA